MIESEEEVKKLNDNEHVPSEVKHWILNTFSSPEGRSDNSQQGKRAGLRAHLSTLKRHIEFNACGKCCMGISSLFCLQCCCKQKVEEVAQRMTVMTTDHHKLQALQNKVHCDQPGSMIEKIEESELEDIAIETLFYHFEKYRHLTYPQRHEEKHKSISIVTAIKAGLNIDRIFRSTKSESTIGQLLPPLVARSLKSVDQWEFNVFNVPSEGNTPLKWVLMDLLSRYDLLERFDIQTGVMVSFCERLEQGYEIFGNPYHNSKHAADVTQTIHFLIQHTGMLHWLTELEIFAMLVAAAAHDFEHTGTTNDFHINTKSELALLYNDKSPLENHHASALFAVMQSDGCNILAGLSRTEYYEFRSLVVDMILCTDMKRHFDQISAMRTMLHGNQPSAIDKRKSMCLILHCADISNPAKPFHIHRRWTEMLLEEYFRQGDDEIRIGLPASPMMDRTTTLVPPSQIGFMDVIVQPAFTVLHDMFDLVTSHILLEVKRHGSRRSSRRGSATNTSTTNTNQAADDQSGNKTVQPPVLKPRENNNTEVFTDEDADEVKEKARTSQKLKAKQFAISKTQSWADSRNQRQSLSNLDPDGKNASLQKPDDEFSNPIEVVRVEEIMDRLKNFREKISGIIADNKAHWQVEQDRDDIAKAQQAGQLQSGGQPAETQPSSTSVPSSQH